jgi:predicted cobalt transporter CbtA
MKCIFKVLCSLGFALGVLISLMYVHGMDPAASANWMVLAWGLIGFAIGALISMILGRACGGSSCEANHHH